MRVGVGVSGQWLTSTVGIPAGRSARRAAVVATRSAHQAAASGNGSQDMRISSVATTPASRATSSAASFDQSAGIEGGRTE